MSKTRVGLIFGGRSGEHEVSLQSARSVLEALDRARYDVVLVAVDKDGRWRVMDPAGFLDDENDPGRIRLRPGGILVVFNPSPGGPHLVRLCGEADPAAGLPGTIDVAFPLVHGTTGEDGALQGLLELAEVPYVGAGVLGSAVGMDKEVMKRLLRDAGLAVVEYRVCRRFEHDADPQVPEGLGAEVGYPLFVKPVNLGSSVGVTRVDGPADLRGAVADAFRYDDKVILERAVDARELECSVLGDDHPEASEVGEVVVRHDFYSYNAKYVDPQGAQLEIPARIPPETREEVRSLALGAFRALECSGMARVDFFLDRRSGRVIVNEINTIPGFTRISMYPKLWEASGLPYPRLLDRLIDLAQGRHRRRSQLARAYGSASGGS